MTITSDFQQIGEEYKQDSAAIESQKLLKKVYNEAVDTNNQIQSIVDSGNFNLIPVSVKQALNTFWTYTKDYINTIEADADVMEVKDVVI